MKYRIGWLICLGMLVTGVAQAQEVISIDAAPRIRQAEALIGEGRPAEAYVLLEPLEPELAGNLEYDYLLGVSAVSSGKASRAVFALERVQAADPAYKDVGLWLSVAYYQSGDRARARSGFEAVAAQGKHDEAQAKAEHYLAALKLDETNEAGRAQLRGKLEAGIGHDSNITDSSPAYLNALQLIAALPATPSNLSGWESILNLGVEARIPISGHNAYAALEDERRSYPGHSGMNSDLLTAQGGMNFTRNDHTYRVGLDWRQFQQQGTAFPITGNVNDYETVGLDARARFKLGSGDFLGIQAQYSQMHFVQLSDEDTNQILLGANYMHVFQSSGSPVVYLGYSNLRARAVRSKMAQNPLYNNGLTVASRDTDVVTLYLQYSLGKTVDLFSSGFMYFRRDAGAFARDAVVDYGKDKTSYLALGLNWRPRPLWTLRSQVAKTINSSNIALYSYSKVEGTVLLKRDFN